MEKKGDKILLVSAAFNGFVVVRSKTISGNHKSTPQALGRVEIERNLEE